MRKQLGKIKSATFGYGGYQGVQFGYQLVFEGEGWGVATPLYGHWSLDISIDERTEWDQHDRLKGFGEAAMKLNEDLKASKKKHVGDLVGVPVEVTFKDNMMHDYRILTEVL